VSSTGGRVGRAQDPREGSGSSKEQGWESSNREGSEHSGDLSGRETVEEGRDGVS
jgi:hypothetical protein